MNMENTKKLYKCDQELLIQSILEPLFEDLIENIIRCNKVMMYKFIHPVDLVLNLIKAEEVYHETINMMKDNFIIDDDILNKKIITLIECILNKKFSDIIINLYA